MRSRVRCVVHGPGKWRPLGGERSHRERTARGCLQRSTEGQIDPAEKKCPVELSQEISRFIDMQMSLHHAQLAYKVVVLV
jgi:hypothetical protein